MKPWEVVLKLGAGIRYTVWARHHEEAYREALLVAGQTDRQPEAIVKEIKKKGNADGKNRTVGSD